MKCLRCHNEDPLYFYLDKDTYYCRKCIAFGRVDVDVKARKRKYQSKKHNVQYQLEYDLTTYQKQVVEQLNTYLKEKKHVLVYAATGAGKTEIVMQSIENYLNKGLKVAIAISRRQVVLEIAQRLKKAFPTLNVVAVCEGHTKKVDGDLIVCTMHQLYRYQETFDLLIMDEVDAFPYRGNEVLEAIAHHSCKGEIIYLSATPDAHMLKEVENDKLAMVTLFKRPHGYPLCVPKCFRMPLLFQYVLLFMFLLKQKQQNKRTLVFVPTIRMANFAAKVFSLYFHCAALTSKTMDKDALALAMRKGEYDFLIATTILERGITIPAIDVVVVESDHIVFNEASLIQIAGRVGRSMKAPKGTCLFLYKNKTEEIVKCISAIKRMNEV